MKIRSPRLALAMLAIANMADAHPVNVSLHPREEKSPSVQLEDRSARAQPGGLPLLDCLDGVVRGDAARAERSCTSALILNPDEHDAYKLRGYAYLLDHRFERAGADFQAALRLKPNDDQDRAGYAQSLSGLGQFSEAVTQYRKALRLAPAKAPYWNGLCWARAGTGQGLSQALQECNRALVLQPGAAAALNSRGLVYLRLKQFGRAIADYTQSLNAGPLQASARFGRGLARLSAGDVAMGQADITEARHRDPEIDALFVLMKVLPVRCARVEGAVCPPGFPEKRETRVPSALIAGQSAP